MAHEAKTLGVKELITVTLMLRRVS